ncbi:hypothetical protein J4421_02730 [Candidatus Woesearchaeota archaeon]|nr:hypothetical protein [Candidatus Woesearchaeota archaeon]
MTPKDWFKKQPSWLKGGFITLSLYFASVFISLFLFVIIAPILDKNPFSVQSGSLSFLIPFIAISFYPGVLFVNSYESVGVIILVNVFFYFALGALIGFLKRRFA